MYRRVFRLLVLIFSVIGAAFAAVAVVVFIVQSGKGELAPFFSEEMPEPQIMILVFGIMGGVFLLAAVILAACASVTKRRQVSLRASGVKVEAAVDQIVPMYAQSVGFRTPYSVTLRWENSRDGKTYIYRSEPLDFNHENYMKEHGINSLPVYMDRENPRHYYVDVERLTANIIVT